MTSTKTHTYATTSGAGIAMGSPAAGDLLIISCSGSTWSGMGATSSPSSSWSCNPIGTYETTAAALQMCYSLSAVGGATTVTPTWTGGADVGCNTSFVHSSAAGTWAQDSNVSVSTGSFLDTSFPGAVAQTAWRSTFTTNGSDDYLFMMYGDEANTQASHTTTPANFVEIQWDNSHVDADAEWLDAPAQSATGAGWDVATANTSSALLINAFTFTASGGGGATTGSATITFGTGNMTTTPGTGVMQLQ